MDLRINETLPIGEVGNLAYRVGLNAVRLETAPTGDESVYLFLEFTISIFAAGDGHLLDSEMFSLYSLNSV